MKDRQFDLSKAVNVESEAIAFVGYLEARSLLLVVFRHTGFYVYRDVPPFLAQGLVAAVSVGKFFNQNVKPFFSFRRFDLSAILFNAVETTLASDLETGGDWQQPKRRERELGNSLTMQREIPRQDTAAQPLTAGEASLRWDPKV